MDYTDFMWGASNLEIGILPDNSQVISVINEIYTEAATALGNFALDHIDRNVPARVIKSSAYQGPEGEQRQLRQLECMWNDKSGTPVVQACLVVAVDPWKLPQTLSFRVHINRSHDSVTLIRNEDPNGPAVAVIPFPGGDAHSPVTDILERIRRHVVDLAPTISRSVSGSQWRSDRPQMPNVVVEKPEVLTVGKDEYSYWKRPERTMDFPDSNNPMIQRLLAWLAKAMATNEMEMSANGVATEFMHRRFRSYTDIARILGNEDLANRASLLEVAAKSEVIEHREIISKFPIRESQIRHFARLNEFGKVVTHQESLVADMQQYLGIRSDKTLTAMMRLAEYMALSGDDVGAAIAYMETADAMSRLQNPDVFSLSWFYSKVSQHHRASGNLVQATEASERALHFAALARNEIENSAEENVLIDYTYVTGIVAPEMEHIACMIANREIMQAKKTYAHLAAINNEVSPSIIEDLSDEHRKVFEALFENDFIDDALIFTHNFAQHLKSLPFPQTRRSSGIILAEITNASLANMLVSKGYPHDACELLQRDGSTTQPALQALVDAAIAADKPDVAAQAVDEFERVHVTEPFATLDDNWIEVQESTTSKKQGHALTDYYNELQRIERLKATVELMRATIEAPHCRPADVKTVSRFVRADYRTLPDATELVDSVETPLVEVRGRDLQRDTNRNTAFERNKSAHRPVHDASPRERQTSRPHSPSRSQRSTSAWRSGGWASGGGSGLSLG